MQADSTLTQHPSNVQRAGQHLDERTADKGDLVGVGVRDLACSDGRMPMRLPRSSVVVELDLTAFNDQAHGEPAVVFLAVEDIEEGTQVLPWTARYDHILWCLTGYGYCDDRENRWVLTQAYRVLKPEGLLLVELNSRYYLLAPLPVRCHL